MSAPQSPFRRGLRRFVRRRSAAVACTMLALLAASALFGPIVLGDAVARQDLALGAAPPSWSHPFGTDLLGRDAFARVLDGARLSLGVSAAATLLSLLIGVPYGALAGYLGGRIDAAMMRLVDVLYGLPSVLFVLLLMAWFGRDPALGLPLLFVGLGAFSWLTTARLVRGLVLSLRERDFVASAQISGAGPWAIVLGHLIPQTTGPVLALATLTMPRVLVEEAFLSFLGLGVGAPRASWGTLIGYGMESFREHPWLVLFPGLVLAATLAALYSAGDALRDAFDPREIAR